MRTLELDASHWETVMDFYNALLPALKAPDWHGRSIGALIDSMVWGGVNSLEPPYTVRITNTRSLPCEVSEQIYMLAYYIEEAKKEFQEKRGAALGVNVVISQ